MHRADKVRVVAEVVVRVGDDDDVRQTDEQIEVVDERQIGEELEGREAFERRPREHVDRDHVAQ